MKKLFTSIALCICCLFAKAQMVEQISMSIGSNTYLTGINNKNFVTGYYTSGNITKGFIITPAGNRLIVGPGTLGVTSTTVESINEQNIALVVGTTGTVKTIYRAYLNEDEILNIVPCTNVMQPNTVPTDINDNNDIVGGYAGTGDFIFIKHDSIVPTGNQAWIAKKYNVGGTFNTFGAGINNANKVAGHYIDGAVLNSFVYDNITHTFNLLNSAFKVKPWDINNNNVIAGEYRQTNGVYMAFFGTVVNGGYTQFTSLNTIFSSNTIQSVANGINDNKDIVGSFLDPNTNTWKGFIYHPNISEYRLPGFDYTQHTWASIDNDGGVPNTAWPQTYWQGIDYLASDPYANNNVPLLDSFMKKAINRKTISPQKDPTWKSFATEFDKNQVGLSSAPNDQDYYQHILKLKIYKRWEMLFTETYGGHCFGFSLSALYRIYNDNHFSSWFNMPAGTNLTTIQNTDNTALFAIERCLNKQMDKEAYMRQNAEESAWGGLYKFKCEVRKPVATANPSCFFFDRHAVLAYKVRTPRILPFATNTVDTVFVYDNAFPGDSTTYITMNAKVYETIDVAATSNYLPSVSSPRFNTPGIRYFDSKQYSDMKSTNAPEYDTTFITGVGSTSDYTLRKNGTLRASYLAGTYFCDSLDINPMQRLDDNAITRAFLMDSTDVVVITSNNYLDSTMSLTQINNSRAMGLSRETLPGETDHSMQKNALIAYSNPDNTTKYLSGFLAESEPTRQQGVNIIVSKICASQGDSIVTSSPSPFVYTVNKVNGNNACTYDLDVFAAYNGAINRFSGQAEIQANSSHTIDPYFVGLSGVQIAVIVDNGNDGTTDDTLFIAGFPVDMKNIINKGGIKIYPNPVHDELNVEFATAGKYSIIITDVVGKTISNNTVSVSAGRTELPMDQLPAGMYLIQVKDEKGNILLKDKLTKQ